MLWIDFGVCDSYYEIRLWASGGTGRRVRLKIAFSQESEGSSPSSPTKKLSFIFITMKTMKAKIFDVLFKVLFSLLLILPILGTVGVFPAPTADLYNTAEAFAFIQTLTETGYIMYMMAIVNVVALIALWAKREALAALLMTPIIANIIGFHFFLDGGIFTAGAIPADILLALELYFLWTRREAYKSLLAAAK